MQHARKSSQQKRTDSVGLGAGCDANCLLGDALLAPTARNPYCARVALPASGKTAENNLSMLKRPAAVKASQAQLMIDTADSNRENEFAVKRTYTECRHAIELELVMTSNAYRYY